MTNPPSLAPESRTQLRRIVAAVTLTLVSAGVVIDHVALSHLIHRTENTAQSSEVTALQRSLSGVEEQLAAIQRQPTAAVQANLSAARQALDERLGKVEQALESRARANDLALLQARLEQIEVRLEKIRRTPLLGPTLVHRRAPDTAQHTIIEPPFLILGTELRGGESFLSIAPSDAQSLAQLRLLHISESQGNWRLEALDGKTATFLVDGQMKYITVP